MESTESAFIIAIAGFADSLFPLGYIFNGLTFFATSTYIYKTYKISILLVIFYAFIGVYTADQLNYFIGKYAGSRVFKIWPLHKKPHLENKARLQLDKHGWWAIYMARFLAPIRPLVPILCGATGYPYWLFALHSFLSTIVWVTFWSLVLKQTTKLI
jgi:membrane protein DedA with SNARE-associated domain